MCVYIFVCAGVNIVCVYAGVKIVCMCMRVCVCVYRCIHRVCMCVCERGKGRGILCQLFSRRWTQSLFFDS